MAHGSDLRAFVTRQWLQYQVNQYDAAARTAAEASSGER